MNLIYRLVFNHAQELMLITSELTQKECHFTHQGTQVKDDILFLSGNIDNDISSLSAFYLSIFNKMLNQVCPIQKPLPSSYLKPTGLAEWPLITTTCFILLSSSSNSVFANGNGGNNDAFLGGNGAYGGAGGGGGAQGKGGRGSSRTSAGTDGLASGKGGAGANGGTRSVDGPYGIGGQGGNPGTPVDPVGAVGEKGGDAACLPHCSGGFGAGGGGGGGAGFNGTSLDIITTTIKGGNGGDGGNALSFQAGSGSDGGSGGGGGAGASLSGLGHTKVNSPIFGGNGGNGGNGAGVGAAGFGGHGGSGITSHGVSITNDFSIVGGNGGLGGSSKINTHSRAGGSGGSGVAGSSLMLTNNGRICGGDGGGSGAAATGIAAGAVAAGGVGIQGSNLHIVNSGSIAGGQSGNGVIQTNAILFSGGTNSLELQAGSIITDNVSGSGNNTLILGGKIDSSFNTEALGTQYQNVSFLQKSGESHWFLTGNNTQILPWSILEGTLHSNSNSALGAGSVSIDSRGTLLFSDATLSLDNRLEGSGTLQLDHSRLSLANNTHAARFSGTLDITNASTLLLNNHSGLSEATTLNLASKADTLTITAIDSFTLNTPLTGNGKVQVNTNHSAFNFGTAVGNGFQGGVTLQDSLFMLVGNNTTALDQATLSLGSGSDTTVGIAGISSIEQLNTLSLSGGSLNFYGDIPHHQAESIISTLSLSADSGNINLVGNGMVNLSPQRPSLLNQIPGSLGMQLINAANASGADTLTLRINGTTVSHATSSAIAQNGHYVANGWYDYELSNGNSNGLYLSYALNGLELLQNHAHTLLIATDAASTSNRDLSVPVSGNGGMVLDATQAPLYVSNEANSYTGSTTLLGGRVVVGANNALGNTSLLTVNSEATLDLNGYHQTVGHFVHHGHINLAQGTLTSGLLSNHGMIEFADGTLVLNAGGASNTTEGLSGAGHLDLQTGMLTINAANNSLAANISIASGATLLLNGSGTVGTSAIDVAGQLDLDRNGVFTNRLSGSGIINNNANLALSGINTFSGTHVINTNGSLMITDTRNLGTTAATVKLADASSRLIFNGLSGEIANTLSGVVGANIQLTHAADLFLSGNNSDFNGQFTIAGNSTLSVAHSHSLGNGTVDIANGSTLHFSDKRFSNTLTGSGEMNIDSNNTLFNFDNTVGSTFQGKVRLQNNLFTLSGDNSLPLKQAALTLGKGNITRVDDGLHTLDALIMATGTLVYEHFTEHHGSMISEGLIAAQTIDTTAGGTISVSLPSNLTPHLDGINLLTLDTGIMIAKLATGAATGSGDELRLTDGDNIPMLNSHHQGISNPNNTTPAAIGTFKYAISTGAERDGLYVNYSLKEVDLLTTGSEALILRGNVSNNGKPHNELQAKITGTGDLAIDAADNDTLITLSNSDNDYTGATLVRSGILQLQADSALGNTHILAISQGASVDLNAHTQTVGMLNSEIASTLNLRGGTLTLLDGGNIGGVITGEGNLILRTGALMLNTNNPVYTGTSQIDTDASTTLHHSGALGLGEFKIEGKLNMAGTTGELANVLQGKGEITFSNAANITLTGNNNNYGGKFSTEANSSLTANNQQNLGAGSVVNQGNLVLDTADYWSFTTPVSGNGTLIKTGKGTLDITDNLVMATTTLIQSGTLLLGTPQTTLNSNVLVETKGTLAGSGQIVGNVTNAGNIEVSNSTLTHLPGRFIINGDYIGNLGNIAFDTLLIDEPSISDKLLITGSTFGQSSISVNNITGLGGEDQEIELITVGGLSTGQFTLNSRAVAGALEYFLHQGSISEPDKGNWYLRPYYQQVNENNKPAYRPEAGSYLANIAAASKVFALRSDDLPSHSDQSHLWLRQQYSRNSFTDASGQLSNDSNHYVVQLGGEVWQQQMASHDANIGIMAGYAQATGSTYSHQTSSRSHNRLSGYSLGVYGTWSPDSQARYRPYLHSWLQYVWFNGSVKGQTLAQEDQPLRGAITSVEGGYPWPLYQSADHRGYLTPQMQLTLNGVRMQQVNEVNGTRVQQNTKNNLQTRIGVKLTNDTQLKTESSSTTYLTSHLTLDYIKNSRSITIDMNDSEMKLANNRPLFAVQVGVEGQLSKNWRLWGNLSKQIGPQGYANKSAMLGARFNF